MVCDFLFLLLNSSSWLHARNTDTELLFLQILLMQAFKNNIVYTSMARFR